MTRSRRSTAVRTLATAVAVTGGLVLAPTAAASAAAPEDCAYMGYGSYPDQLGLQFDVNEQWVADNINAYRAQNGLPALAVSELLRRPTMWGALDSALRRFAPPDHIDSRGMGIAQRAQFCSGYTGRIAEINYYGYGGTADDPYYYGSGRAALAWWKQSPGHNALLLSRDHTTYAVGFAYQGHNAEEGYWVVMFGDH